MKVLLEIKDGKVDFVMELLNNLNFITVKKLSDEKVEFISNIQEAVEELNLIKQGKLKGIPAKELFNEF